MILCPEMRCYYIRRRAEAKMGALLRDTEKAKGGDHGGRPKIDGSRKEPSNETPTLAEIGVTKKQSSEFQQLAAVPKAQFDAADHVST
jgi:hypothetical protein